MNRTICDKAEKKFGVSLGYKTDEEMHQSLSERGLPTLSRLLKMFN